MLRGDKVLGLDRTDFNAAILLSCKPPPVSLLSLSLSPPSVLIVRVPVSVPVESFDELELELGDVISKRLLAVDDVESSS